ncbi:MAG: hypothetical protein M9951_17405 [Burkholderiaceae bacterium]|jgi:hypothetical protein|nr:hypothetical protein [Burkholderiaceae bacterium]MEB2319518.1 hypothetical protein [Pseudomonadota bacterium]
MRHIPETGRKPPAARIPAHATRSLQEFRHLLVLVLAYALLLALLALELPESRFLWVFSEEGPFEILSIGFWVLLAVACFTLPGLPRWPWEQGIVALVAAAREADLHKAFTDTSVLKISYYLKSSAPLFEKLLVGLVALPALAIVVYVLVRGALLIRRTRAWHFAWGRTALLAMSLLVSSKLLDRMEAVTADWFAFHFPPLAHRFIAAFEEGTECLLPVLFIVVLLQYQYQHLTGATGSHAPHAGNPLAR